MIFFSVLSSKEERERDPIYLGKKRLLIWGIEKREWPKKEPTSKPALFGQVPFLG